MALYADLTPTEKDIIDAHNNNIRAWAGQLARLAQSGQALDDNWNAQVSAIITTLDAGSEVPDAGGLAGAADISKEEFQSIMTSLGNLLATYNTDAARQLYVKLAGPGNVV
jgi:hypothetical protein